MVIHLKFLTIKQIINDPLLKKVSVLFFEAPSPLVVFQKDEYKFCTPEFEIFSKVKNIIDDDSDKLCKTIFEFDNQKMINENFLIVSEVEKLKKAYVLKKFETDRKQAKAVEKISAPIIKIASKKVQNKRLKICKDCEFFDANALKGNGVCNDCNCPILHKIKFVDNTCPKAKWN